MSQQEREDSEKSEAVKIKVNLSLISGYEI